MIFLAEIIAMSNDKESGLPFYNRCRLVDRQYKEDAEIAARYWFNENYGDRYTIEYIEVSAPL